MNSTKNFIYIAVAVLFTLPGFYLRLIHPMIDPPLMALLTGAAILSASFLLLWACDTAQKDISQSLALAVVAFIAVLPEYAVDMYFTWRAGQYPESAYANYAIANMTGANRLLIGVAWSVIAAIFWFKARRGIALDEDRRLEIFFLGLATVYAFIIPLKGDLAWYDGIVFVAMFIFYIRIAGRRPCEECELEGPAELMGSLPKIPRRVATAVMFFFSAGVILTNAEPFSESLVASGKVFGINEFLLVQWLAPIASEAPEFLVAIMMALRGQATLALGSLISSKLNQWTLLVGMIPGVYGVSRGTFATPIPLSEFQMVEILLTAAQSLLAISLIVGMRLNPRGAFLLFMLFIGQLLAPVILAPFAGNLPFQLESEYIHLGFSTIYVMTSLFFLFKNRAGLAKLHLGLQSNGDSCTINTETC